MSLHAHGRSYVVAHRGASAHAPENTLAAYRHAHRLGAMGAECDVQVSADGEVVLLHDRSLSRTTDSRGLVSRRTWAQLRQLDAGSWKGEGFAGEGIPRLRDALAFTRGRMRMFVELKAGRGLAERSCEAAQAAGVRDEDLVFMSFDPRLLAGVEAGLPQIPRVLLRRKPLFGGQFGRSVVDQALAAGAQALGLNHKGVGPEVVRHAHEAGLAVLTFTVNDIHRGRELAAMGVDGLISDVPQRIERSLRRPSRARTRGGLPALQS